MMRDTLSSQVCGDLLIEVDESRIEGWVYFLPNAWRGNIFLQLSAAFLQSFCAYRDLPSRPIDRVDLFADSKPA